MIESTVPEEFNGLAGTQATHEHTLLDKPNVVGVALGNKYTNGVDTGEKGISVLVESKVREHLLGADELIPRTVDGVALDVQEVGILQAGNEPPADGPGDREPAGSQALTSRARPAFGGLSIGHFRITAGTLGTCCYDAEGFPGKPTRYYLLSNNHVLANSNNAAIGDPILQPGPVDGGTSPTDVIARLSRFVPIKFTHPGQPAPLNLVDAAIAEGEFADLERRIYWIGYLSGVEPTPRPDELVRKCGRTSNFSTGRIRNINATVNVNYGEGKVARFARQILTTDMSEGGDSGSVVAGRDGRAVGLLFAGSPQVTIASPMSLVQDKLGIRVSED